MSQRVKRESPLGPAARAVADTREGVFVPIDLVKFTGDLLSAVFLGQVLYWFGTGKDGFCRAQVTFKDDDRLWLAKSDESWFDEAGLTAAQARRIRAAFQERGWIDTAKRRFSGAPTTHITLRPELLAELEEWHSVPASEKVKRDRITVSARSATLPDQPFCELAESDRSGMLPNPGSGNMPDESPRVAESITDDLQTPTDNPPREAAVACDDGRPPEGKPTITAQRILGATIAAAFDWDPLLRDKDQHRQVIACVTKLAGKGVGADHIEEIRDRAWWLRASPKEPPNPSPAQLGQRWGTIRIDPVVVIHREAAAGIVREVVSQLGRTLAVEDRLAAEFSVASMLGRGKSREDIAAAMERVDVWSIKYLERSAIELEHDRTVAARRTAAGSFEKAPEELGPLLTLDLIGLLRRGVPPMDVPRVATEIQDRADRLKPSQRERVHSELTSGAFCEVNQIPAHVRVLIRRYAPTDQERDAKNAANLAVWGEIGVVEQPALPAGRGL